MPKASARHAASAKTGARASVRRAYLTSCHAASSQCITRLRYEPANPRTRGQNTIVLVQYVKRAAETAQRSVMGLPLREEISREVLQAAVDGNCCDPLAGSELSGELQRGGDVQPGRRAGEDAFLLGEPAR